MALSSPRLDCAQSTRYVSRAESCRTSVHMRDVKYEEVPLLLQLSGSGSPGAPVAGGPVYFVRCPVMPTTEG